MSNINRFDMSKIDSSDPMEILNLINTLPYSINVINFPGSRQLLGIKRETNEIVILAENYDPYQHQIFWKVVKLNKQDFAQVYSNGIFLNIVDRMNSVALQQESSNLNRITNYHNAIHLFESAVLNVQAEN